jgi:DNA-binding NtrC family response regulator
MEVRMVAGELLTCQKLPPSCTTLVFRPNSWFSFRCWKNTMKLPQVVALLITEDATLTGAFQKIIDAVKGLRLEVGSALSPGNAGFYRNQLALVILHLGRRKSDMDELKRIIEKGRFPDRQIGVLVISDQPNSSLELMLAQQGVAQFLERPLDLHRLAYLVESLTIRARDNANRGVADDKGVIGSLGSVDPYLFAPGSQMGRMMESISRIAPHDTTVLLTGETGTGKSKLASLIHELSPRRAAPFQVINCGALSNTLVESELFGHVKGAFTGADRDRTGKCAEVGGGTLVLDEVDTLSLEMQAKLLRLVEDRVFEPVGSNRLLPMAARLIVATNRNLREEIASRRFRADLYYRLNVVEFGLTPLRDRLRSHPEEVVHLAENFLNLSAAKIDREIEGFTPEALEALKAYQWPGNIREVRNVVERAVALGNGPFITLEELPGELRADSPHAFLGCHAGPPTAVTANGSLVQIKEQAEIARISQALAKHPGNRNRAALELGISRMTLYNKLRRYGL